jgi:hypothetical protein
MAVLILPAASGWRAMASIAFEDNQPIPIAVPSAAIPMPSPAAKKAAAFGSISFPLLS